MKLYKQKITSDETIEAKLILITEGETQEELKRKAERLATLDDGFTEFMWQFGDNPDEYTHMNVGEKYLFIVRSW